MTWEDRLALAVIALGVLFLAFIPVACWSWGC